MSFSRSREELMASFYSHSVRDWGRGACFWCELQRLVTASATERTITPLLLYDSLINVSWQSPFGRKGARQNGTRMTSVGLTGVTVTQSIFLPGDVTIHTSESRSTRCVSHTAGVLNCLSELRAREASRQVWADRDRQVARSKGGCRCEGVERPITSIGAIMSKVWFGKTGEQTPQRYTMMAAQRPAATARKRMRPGVSARYRRRKGVRHWPTLRPDAAVLHLGRGEKVSERWPSRSGPAVS
jgi:hypothetical protein